METLAANWPTGGMLAEDWEGIKEPQREACWKLILDVDPTAKMPPSIDPAPQPTVVLCPHCGASLPGHLFDCPRHAVEEWLNRRAGEEVRPPAPPNDPDPWKTSEPDLTTTMKLEEKPMPKYENPILHEREAAYGPPEKNLECQAHLIDTYLTAREEAGRGPVLHAHEFAMMMALAKIGRVATGPRFHEDNYRDAIGYLELAMRLAPK